MTDSEQHIPGPARGAQARKDGEKWTLIVFRQLCHSPGKVWQSISARVGALRSRWEPGGWNHGEISPGWERPRRWQQQ